ncbi:CCA-adding enzyme / 2'-nucleotidase / 2',3'-cyclic phosphodiesterase / Phosphatase [Vibrio chagasii]|nr:CCA-adding enzyme / 2'-nucleotidase / 2',3'-cyclic phosphodiesterase / Phosphatase [Vibrio chagasii]
MKARAYLVGGAVRDQLLGKEPKDLDYVIVGSTIEEMEANGFTKVGKDFPVFLHPESKDEYALARKETKNGVGYHGFKCEFGVDVTLEEDLYRRDLTINSIARDLTTGELFDPYNGLKDIEDKVLRHTNPDAFTDDPLRALRLARFAAQLGDEWSIHPETMKLIPAAAKELYAVSSERLWGELFKTLNSKSPWRFFEVLKGTGAFPMFDIMEDTPQRADYHPEGNVWIHTGLVVDYASKHYNDPLVTFGALVHDLGKPVTYKKTGGKLHGHDKDGVPITEALCDMLKCPSEYRAFGVIATKLHQKLHDGLKMSPSGMMRLFKDSGALRGESGYKRFMQLLNVGVADSRGRGKPFDTSETPELEHLKKCLDAVCKIDNASVMEAAKDRNLKGAAIGELLHKERLKAIKQVEKI